MKSFRVLTAFLWLPLALASLMGEGSCGGRGKAPAPPAANAPRAEANAPRAEVTPLAEAKANVNRKADKVEKATKALPASRWGGQGIRLDLTADGAAIEYDCAHGTIERRVEPDEEGRFEAEGRHVEETGGPSTSVSAVDESGKEIRGGAGQDGHPARYVGRVEGGTMTLTVTLADTGRKVGTFSLKRDASPRLRKCQ